MLLQNPTSKWYSDGTLVYSCQYHVIWCTKYRRKVLPEPMRARLHHQICSKQSEWDFRLRALLSKSSKNILQAKRMSNYRTYIIAKKPKSDPLDELNRLGGRIYSKTVSLMRKTHETKGFWLSQGGAKKYLKFKESPCHAHSVQAIIDDYYGALKSYHKRVKKDPKARPPYKTGKYHTFTW